MGSGKKGISRHSTKQLVDGADDELTAQNHGITGIRSLRRAADLRAKQKVVRKEKQGRYPRLDSATVGIEASCHSKRCSCWMCGNPRRYSKDKLTLQEKRHGIGENCSTCVFADETVQEGFVYCDCSQSEHYEDEMSLESWCKQYKEM